MRSRRFAPSAAQTSHSPPRRFARSKSLRKKPTPHNSAGGSIPQPNANSRRTSQRSGSPKNSPTRSKRLTAYSRLPRGAAYLVLSNARDAFRDGLYWQVKTLPASALVVNANSLADPSPLRQIDLGPDAAARAAADNLRAARKFIRRAEEELK